jgi:hypothetical protein
VEDDEIIRDVDDEEIPEGEAFNSDDERVFGHFHQDKNDSHEQREKKRHWILPMTKTSPVAKSKTRMMTMMNTIAIATTTTMASTYWICLTS